MSIFSSRREKRLWLGLLAVMIAIYATLGFGNTFAGILKDRQLLTPVFILGLLLVIVSVVTQGLKSRPGGWEIALGIGIAACYMLMMARLAVPDAHRGHLIEYSIVSILVLEALLERVRNGKKVAVPAILALLISTLLGVLDEGIQYLLPNRVFDPLDIVFNFLASTMAISVSSLLAWLRKYLKKEDSP